MTTKEPKYNLDYINNLISETAELIDDNPLYQATGEIQNIRENFESVQKLIQSQGENKSSLLGKLLSKMVGETDKPINTFESKISQIFRQFDTTHDGVKSVIKMFDSYIKRLHKELVKLDSFLEKYPDEFKSSLQFKNYTSLLGTLKLSHDRTLTNLNSAISISETMETSRPIFQGTLSACMIEVSGQQAIESSTQMISVLSGTVESLSNQLTANTIINAQKSLDVSTRPALSSGVIQENMVRLGTAITDLENQKQKLLK